MSETFGGLGWHYEIRFFAHAHHIYFLVCCSLGTRQRTDLNAASSTNTELRVAGHLAPVLYLPYHASCCLLLQSCRDVGSRGPINCTNHQPTTRRHRRHHCRLSLHCFRLQSTWNKMGWEEAVNGDLIKKCIFNPNRRKELIRISSNIIGVI